MGAVEHSVSLQVAGATEADATYACCPAITVAAAATSSNSSISKC